MWHYCDQDGTKHSFLCPNGTIFSQVTFICDWWFNVDCNTAVQLYVTNEALSLLPAPPEKTFPEDFNGPIVDWYIYQRHQERAYRKVGAGREPTGRWVVGQSYGKVDSWSVSYLAAVERKIYFCIVLSLHN